MTSVVVTSRSNSVIPCGHTFVYLFLLTGLYFVMLRSTDIGKFVVHIGIIFDFSGKAQKGDNSCSWSQWSSK